MPSPCPLDGCTKPRYDGHLCCSDHWYRVSKELRTEVLEAWAAHRSDPRNRELWDVYRAAADAALVEASLASY